MERTMEVLLKVRVDHQRPDEPGQMEDLADDLALAVARVEFREGSIEEVVVEDCYER